MEAPVPGQPDFAHAQGYALHRLTHQLSPLLHYHCLDHTLKDTLPAAERLCCLEGVDDYGTMLVKTAMTYHDVGFTVQIRDHEKVSAQVAAQVLPGFGYSPEEVRQICRMILVTHLFTPPLTQLEAIVVDADLDLLGREDFWQRNQALRTELADTLNILFTDEAWLEEQLKFMDIHRYRTISAQGLRGQGKRCNRASLLRQLERTRQEKRAS